MTNWVNRFRQNNPDSERSVEMNERVELAELRNENRELRMERDFLKNGGLLRQDPTVIDRYELMAAEKANFPIEKMCVWLNVSRSGFYEWRRRPLSETAKRQNTFVSLIGEVFDSHRGVYGHRRVHAMLAASGHRIGLGLVRALMRRQGLVARQVKAYKRTTVADLLAAAPADLIGRNFTATAPGTKLVGDMTYIKTGEG